MKTKTKGRSFLCPNCATEIRVLEVKPPRRAGTHWRGVFSSRPACGAESVPDELLTETSSAAACAECRRIGRRQFQVGVTATYTKG